MRIISDLHIHSRFSRATSKTLNIANLEKYAGIKGLNLLGTGDFTHPEWIKELKNELTEDGTGILKTKTGFNFLLQTEISLIYSQSGKGRRVHNVVLAKSFDVAEQINNQLRKKGRLDYDGRPIFGMSCVEFTELMKNIDKDIEIIPAHIWTPWFSLFGSNSGFDSVKECFQEKAKEIHAIETGLSSDPAMNWRLSQLDSFSIVSFSDLHSYWPWRIGREATVFNCKLDYDEIISSLKNKKIESTIEVDPSYGKYHFDGHRACSICLSPKEAIKNKNNCPKCGKKLTIGVLHRVEELADREEGYKPKDAIPFKSLIPLSEILSSLLGTSLSSQKIWKEYYNLVNKFGSELNVLLEAEKEELEKAADEKVAEAIINNREGKIKINPGYDGVYGQPVFSSENNFKNIENQERQKHKENQQGLSKFF
ncbi:endonuclease Q family protein [Candidatus Woesearchaeota archaeon]|nr:endonuclease Q family protein [Candidatus Woesearchaeota archaeon]